MNPRRRRERNALRQLNKSTAYVPAPELKVAEAPPSLEPEFIAYSLPDEDPPAVEEASEVEEAPEAQETHTEPVSGKKGRRGRR